MFFQFHEEDYNTELYWATASGAEILSLDDSLQ